jgi:broad specificity phosphatase PhoE
MTMMAKKQSVWIIRYGLTEHPLVENLGPFDSDIHPVEGVEHAQCIAKRIAESQDSPAIVYSSPFLRTAHTAHILATELSGTPVKLEEGLWEWLTPSLLVEPNGVKTEPRSAAELAGMFDTIDASYESVNPVAKDDSQIVPEGSPHFIENEDALLMRCATTITRLLDAAQGKSIAIVSHAPCDQAIAFHLEGAATVSESKLGPWPLGGITMFSRTLDGGQWTMEMYGDTKHMPGKYAPGIKEWSLPCLTRAPEQQ